MYRGILIALLSGVILLAFAALPPMLPGSTTASLSGSAQAEKAPLPTPDATNLNSSRSNVNRMGGGGGTKAGGNPAKGQSNTQTPKGNQLNPQPEPPGRTKGGPYIK